MSYQSNITIAFDLDLFVKESVQRILTKKKISYVEVDDVKKAVLVFAKNFNIGPFVKGQIIVASENYDGLYREDHYFWSLTDGEFFDTIMSKAFERFKQSYQVNNFKIAQVNASRLIKQYKMLPFDHKLFSDSKVKETISVLFSLLPTFDNLAIQFKELRDLINEYDLPIQILTLQEIVDVPHYLLFAIFNDGYYFFRQTRETEKDDFIIYHFLYFLSSREQINIENVSIQESLQNEIMASFIHPFAFLNESHDLLLYNSSFLELGLSRNLLIELENDQNIMLKDVSYKVIKKVDPETGHMVIVLASVLCEESGERRFDELGIICSSIAHELNNPIGGILAAATVLSLEEWSDDERGILQDIEKSALRCKHLVEIFLGFSRTNINQNKNVSLKLAIETAYSLLTFRVAELGVRPRIEYSHEIENKQVNSSILTMIFYLLFNEMITQYSHYSLIEGRKGDTFAVRFDFIDSCLVLSYGEIFIWKKIYVSLLKSRLFLHLLQLVDCTLSESGIEFKVIE